MIRRICSLSFALLILALLTAGWHTVYWLGDREDTRQRQMLLDATHSFAYTLDPATILSLEGTTKDLSSQSYLRLKRHLRALLENIPDARFAYLIKETEGQVIFLVDSEDVGSPDESPAGQVYEEASSGLKAVFKTRQPSVIGPETDRWGTWISGFVPLINPRDGTVIALFGIDIDASYFKQAIFFQQKIGIALFSLLLLVTVSGAFLYRRFLIQIQNSQPSKQDPFLRLGGPALIVITGVALSVLLFFDTRRRSYDFFVQAFRIINNSSFFLAIYLF